MSLDAKLKTMVEKYQRWYMKDDQENIDLDMGWIAALIQDFLNESTTLQSFSNEFKKAKQQLKEDLRIVDSVDIIKAYVLNRQEVFIREIKLHADLNKSQTRIDSLLGELELRNKKFAYVAWKHKPEEFYYVGQGNSTRLKLRQHGPLASILKEARWLSLIIPKKRCRAETIERALLTFLTAYNDGLPIRNAQNSKLPKRDWEPTKRLRQCSRILGQKI